jgi:hypothetical protein
VVAPTLFIQRVGTNAMISWSPATPGFVLQSSPALAPAAWTDAPSGAQNPVTVAATGLRFYRLRKP